jgi:DNA-binding MarR family transcriptional regulator
MTSPSVETPLRPASPRSAVEELTTGLSSLFQALQRMKAAASRSGEPEAERERAAHVLLFPLCHEGPLRQTELAELVHADPSTVSRHVARLVDQGLVTRVPDERDGRASRLVVTEAGHAALDALRSERERHLEQVTADWSAEDLAAFTTLFGRLLDDISASLPGAADGGAPLDLPKEIR